MSASPSSSHATQTGRPSLWNESSERRLARLYVYTTLPLEKIVKVVHRSTPGNKDCPGKDSANKKLNSILDKEPRWLHPRTRTDMERRISALDSSPTRQTTPENAYSPGYPRSISSDSRSHLSVNPDFKHESGNSPTVNDFQPFEHSRSSSAGWGPPTAGPLPTLLTTDFATVPPPEMGIRRQTTTLTLQEVLSQYSTGFIRQVDKLLKRYTMPSNTMKNQSPMDEDRPGTADSNPASWIFEYDAPQGNSEMGARPLPGDFLNLHRHVARQGFCIEGFPEHDSRSCFCHLKNELTSESWVTDTGPSPYAQHILLHGVPPDGRLDQRDAFGNTILHLLAAGDARHELLFRAIESSPNPSATNSAGQTFLHVLNDTWFAHKAVSLFQLIKYLQRSEFLYACDVYGRNFCHVLHSKEHGILDRDTKNALLKLFDAMEYCRRDAFGNIPESAPIGLPVRRAYTAAVGQEMSPARGSRTLRQVSSPIEEQAELLKLVNDAHTHVRIQDKQGRNGLHCLADAILSQDSLFARFPQHLPNASGKEQQQPTTAAVAAAAPGRKRKHNKPVLGGSLFDSSKDRLTIRERIVRDLIELGVDPNHYDKYGNTVLMAFVAQLPEDDDYKKPVQILEFLIEAGADVNARNRNGETALHIAVRRGKKLAMRTLTQHGANAHARDVEGRSVLQVADRMVVSSKQNIQYSHYEACHAWLSGQAKAVQSPTVHQEWELR
ncbi:Ankyrin repeat protein [Colletotrichum higginsianum IMI 349063]|uniref:Ankyrin repeat protein n=2 Tax=Colletotrichum higginsianum TaxID=80884 RepID=A0A1B7Y4F1_COLHI|nr:Ankyrin repeat protein [Colletotrichum higginsianum IMI 349063]OBR06863.1 Ankyrin repeat protein [Colletotrichum higginsianum IMI 349063]TIC96956.1 Ankyrin repeat protein [Colletotrichum higginsianum]